MKKEKSCGIIVFDEDNKVLLVKHKKGHYGFPKGHVEGNETEEETAIREVKEETNCDASIISGFREVITYSPKEDIIKDVVFFLGKSINKNLNPQESEVSDAVFVTIEEAFELITHEDVEKLLRKAIDYRRINEIK